MYGRPLTGEYESSRASNSEHSKRRKRCLPSHSHATLCFFCDAGSGQGKSPAAEFMLGNQSEDKIDVPLDTVVIEFAIFVSPRESSAALFDLLLALCQISAPKTRRHGGHWFYLNEGGREVDIQRAGSRLFADSCVCVTDYKRISNKTWSSTRNW